MKRLLLALALLSSMATTQAADPEFVPPAPLPAKEFATSKYRGTFIEGYRQGYTLANFRAAQKLPHLKSEALRSLAHQRSKELYKTTTLPKTTEGFTDGYMTGFNDFQREAIRPSMVEFVKSATVAPSAR